MSLAERADLRAREIWGALLTAAGAGLPHVRTLRQPRNRPPRCGDMSPQGNARTRLEHRTIAEGSATPTSRATCGSWSRSSEHGFRRYLRSLCLFRLGRPTATGRPQSAISTQHALRMDPGSLESSSSDAQSCSPLRRFWHRVEFVVGSLGSDDFPLRPRGVRHGDHFGAGEQGGRGGNASGTTPVVFLHGLWLLPSSWANWADTSSSRPVTRR
jgi:hypothetical protein